MHQHHLLILAEKLMPSVVNISTTQTVVTKIQSISRISISSRITI
jgi:hypothetical protein